MDKIGREERSLSVAYQNQLHCKILKLKLMNPLDRKTKA